MSTSQRRRESAWKSRKQNRQPHGKISSLRELANETKPDGPTESDG
ncbi:DUF6254 family protein [Paenibacillaceae bacterium WGS1546]